MVLLKPLSRRALGEDTPLRNTAFELSTSAKTTGSQNTHSLTPYSYIPIIPRKASVPFSDERPVFDGKGQGTPRSSGSHKRSGFRPQRDRRNRTSIGAQSSTLAGFFRSHLTSHGVRQRISLKGPRNAGNWSGRGWWQKPDRKDYLSKVAELEEW